MATEDARYRQSTQFRLWSYSPGQLADLRAKTNSLARQNISERLSSSSVPVSATASANPSGANTPNPTAAGVSTATAPADVPADLLSSAASASAAPSVTPSVAPLPEFLTPAEEEQLLAYYTVQTLRAAEFCQLPTEIRATAAIFLRRFYLTHSVMTYPPAKMMKTCVFFGAKAENYYPRVAHIATKFPKTTGDEILAGEFLLCQGIRFAFDVRHPYRALDGATMQLRSFDDVDDSQVTKAQARAREILKYSPIVTDAYFHYTPSQIMLAALSIADHSLFERLMDATFPRHLPDSGTSTPGANGRQADPRKSALVMGQAIKKKTVDMVQACQEMLLQEPPERLANFWGTDGEGQNLVAKPLLKKLRKCRDPDRFDLIALHKKRLEFREKEVGGGGGGGGGAGRPVDEDGAVFGGELANRGGEADRESKRRKVAAEDPFGPSL